MRETIKIPQGEMLTATSRHDFTRRDRNDIYHQHHATVWDNVGTFGRVMVVDFRLVEAWPCPDMDW